jgi:DNA-binding GntR family transcriptional regulator
LSEKLGVSRGDLRKALVVLEKDGRIWRHASRKRWRSPRSPGAPTPPMSCGRA